MPLSNKRRPCQFLQNIKQIIHFSQFLSWLAKVCALHLVQRQVLKKGKANNDSTITLNKDSDIKVEISDRISIMTRAMDGVDILLFKNPIDIFSGSIFVLLSLLQSHK